jgi:hypothetical protein
MNSFKWLFYYLTQEKKGNALILWMPVAQAEAYCPIRGMGEKPSPLGEDFSMIK